MTTTEQFVLANDVAHHLGLSESAIRHATTRAANPIPHHRVPHGRSVRYLLSETSEWMRGQVQP